MVPWTRRSWLLLLALLALAAVLKVEYQRAWAAREPLADAPYGDSVVYLDEAQRHFVEHVDEAFFKPPVYTAVLAMLDAGSAPGRTLVRAVQGALGLVVLAVVFILARARGGDVAGACALLAALAYAPLTFHETKLLDTTFALSLALLASLALDRVVRRGGAGWAVIAGALFGLAGCTWSGWLPAAAVAGVVLLLGRSWRIALVFAAGIALPLVPVLVHNVRTGELVAVGYADGVAFLVGNNPNARGINTLPPGWPEGVANERLTERAHAAARLGHDPTPGEQRAESFAEGFGWLRTHPAEAAALLRDKIRLLVSAWEPGDNDLLPREQERFGLLPWARLPFLALLAAGLFGLALPRARPRAPLLVPLAAGAALLLVMFVLSRYRVALAPFLAVGAGVAVAWLVDATLRRASWREAVVPAACASVPLVLALLLPLPYTAADVSESELFFDLVLDAHAAQAAEAHGDAERAAAILADSVADHPGDVRAEDALRDWLAARPEADRAALRQAALRADPDSEAVRRLAASR